MHVCLTACACVCVCVCVCMQVFFFSLVLIYTCVTVGVILHPGTCIYNEHKSQGYTFQVNLLLQIPQCLGTGALTEPYFVMLTSALLGCDCNLFVVSIHS